MPNPRQKKSSNSIEKGRNIKEITENCGAGTQTAKKEHNEKVCLWSPVTLHACLSCFTA